MSQADDLLSMLRDRGEVGVTPLDALAELRIYRLAARISDLRAAGHDIETRHDYDPHTERRRPEARYVLREHQTLWGDWAPGELMEAFGR
jgi:hypothetical protein